MKPGSRHDQGARARIAEGTRAAMASPEVRRRISERTREGMLAASELQHSELHGLRTAWRAARPVARQRWLAELFALICGGNEP
jgi:hypothetical protein